MPIACSTANTLRNQRSQHPAPSTQPCRWLANTLVLLLLLLPSCLNAPNREKKGLLVGTQRVLALDFGRQVTGQRVQRLRRLPSVFGGEMKRARHLLGLDGSNPLPRVAGREMKRTLNLTSRTLEAFATELRRQPHQLDGVIPSSFEFSRNTANNLDTAMRFFGIGKRIMPEITDKEHRTSHRDNRPERTLWQRIRRRLPI